MERDRVYSKLHDLVREQLNLSTRTMGEIDFSKAMNTYILDSLDWVEYIMLVEEEFINTEIPDEHAYDLWNNNIDYFTDYVWRNM